MSIYSTNMLTGLRCADLCFCPFVPFHWRIQLQEGFAFILEMVVNLVFSLSDREGNKEKPQEEGRGCGLIQSIKKAI